LFWSGKFESIIITNEKGGLSQDEIDRMVAEAEKFVSEDEAQRKRIEAVNSLPSFVYGLKSQLSDQEGQGQKIASIYDQRDYGLSASVEDLEEKLAGSFPFLSSSGRQCLTSFQEVQGVINPITSLEVAKTPPHAMELKVVGVVAKVDYL
jgi:endoplasmic reticulum chaperone BiP